MRVRYFIYLAVPLSLSTYQPANAFQSYQNTLFDRSAFSNEQLSRFYTSPKMHFPHLLQQFSPERNSAKNAPFIELSPLTSSSKKQPFTQTDWTNDEIEKTAKPSLIPELQEEKQGWGKWLLSGIKEGIRSITQRPFGERMQPSILKKQLQKVENIDKDHGWLSSKTTYFDGINPNAPIYHRKADKEGQDILVAAPAHDMDDSMISTLDWTKNGNLSIKEVLEAVEKENSSRDFKLFIPVAQSNRYFGIFTRRHWTTLEIERSKGHYKATHYDSKGTLSSAYSLQHIQKQLPSTTNLTAVYTGHQGFFNDKDCGRYTISYINQRLKGEKPQTSTASKVMGLFSKLWKS